MQPAQEVFGPARGGYYVAAYACQVGSSDGEYVGYYKICRRRPETYWDASDCVAKGSTRVNEPTEFLAIDSHR